MSKVQWKSYSEFQGLVVKRKISIFEIMLDTVRKKFFLLYLHVFEFLQFWIKSSTHYVIWKHLRKEKEIRTIKVKALRFETRSSRSLNEIFLYEFILVLSSEIIQFPIVNVQWCSSLYVRYNYITHFCAHVYLLSRIILMKLQSVIHNLTVIYPCWNTCHPLSWNISHRQAGSNWKFSNLTTCYTVTIHCASFPTDEQIGGIGEIARKGLARGFKWNSTSYEHEKNRRRAERKKEKNCQANFPLRRKWSIQSKQKLVSSPFRHPLRLAAKATLPPPRPNSP